MAIYDLKTTAEEIFEACASQIRGKTILTTGVSPNGLGAAFVETLAKFQPKLLILAGRDAAKAALTAEAISTTSPGIQTRVLELDLGSQVQIRKAAEEVNAYEETIDVLVNNAGVMACPYSTTTDGLEHQFGTNHIGHFLFTNLILGKILATGPGARVISVSSDGYRLGPVRFDDYDFHGGESYNRWRAYGQSKSANMLFAVSLAEKLGGRGLLAFSLHPGVISTNHARSLSMAEVGELVKLDKEMGNAAGWRTGFPYKTVQHGIATHAVAAFDPSIADHNGSYLAESQIVPVVNISSWARDKVEAEKLWKLSEKLVGQDFTY